MKSLTLTVVFLIGLLSFTKAQTTDTTYCYIYYTSIDSALSDMQIENHDANNNLILQAYYYWDSGINDWIGGDKDKWTYDANNNQTSYEHYTWDININDWVGISKYEYSYDTNNNRILNVSYTWDSSINDWVGSNKQEDTYDANSNLTLHIYYDWDSGINDWIGHYKEEYTYDTNNNQTLYAYYNWDSSINDWIGNFKSVYTYDINSNLTVNAYYEWNNTINDWLLRTKCYYNYDTYLIEIAELNQNSFNLFPNPTKDKVIIESEKVKIESIEILSLTGKTVKQLIINKEQTTIYLGNLAKGVYFVKVFTVNGVSTQKLILE